MFSFKYSQFFLATLSEKKNSWTKFETFTFIVFKRDLKDIDQTSVGPTSGHRWYLERGDFYVVWRCARLSGWDHVWVVRKHPDSVVLLVRVRPVEQENEQ